MPVWLNGALAHNATAEFNLNDKGLLLGYGIFDTALVINEKVAYRPAHLEKLAASCAALSLPVDPTRFSDIMDEAVRDLDLGVLRITVTGGVGPRGMAFSPEAQPNIIVSAAPLAPTVFCPEIRLTLTPVRRNETSFTARIKTLNYLDAIMAVTEAHNKGFEDALFLNMAGHVACGSTGNIFMVRDGGLITPPISDGILAGVMRANVIRLAKARNIPVEERSISYSELLEADDVFLTNSLRVVSQVTQIGDVMIPRRSSALIALLESLVFEEINYCRGKEID
ncbi:MAG: aminotransferase class IV [Zymomonas mobilis]|uniref:Probable branched-chain-amino-acid aminotransferase n=1 Tax=Zymomonas mobilis TaxID=542 RepID=A0A542VZA2_ZYMMB|nr:aminotransferase class IV [Zymomonas mobilis]TQL16655.1 branched-chain amino acid aminotransferase [Zymomonas mobilis]